MTRTLRRLAPLRFVIGPVLLVAIAMKIDRASVLEALVRADAGLVLAGGFVVMAAIPLRAWRWGALLRRMGHVLDGRDALRLYAEGTFAGVATPGRLGEMVKVKPLVDRGVPVRRAIASVVLDRGFDVGLAIAVAALYGATTAYGGRALAALVPLGGALAVVGLFVARRLAVSTLAEAGIGSWVSRSLPPAPSRWEGGTLHDARGLPIARASHDSGGLALLLLLTVASSVCAWAANHLLVRALGLPLGPLETAGVSAAAGLATMAPVSVLGVGTRDAALLFLLARYGVSPGDAVALATLFLLLNLWTGLACAAGTLVPRRPAT